MCKHCGRLNDFLAKHMLSSQFVSRVTLLRDKVPGFDRYPFSLPAVRELEALDLHPRVTFLVGENGSGKSTLLEGIAVALGFNAEGGSRNFSFATRASHSIFTNTCASPKASPAEHGLFPARGELLQRCDGD
jgi:predicted ATPase